MDQRLGGISGTELLAHLAAQGTPLPPSSSGPTTPSAKVSATVAVVDDDPSVRRALDRLLRSAGFGVVTFESAEQFLGLCHPQAVGCLVLDLQLGGMSGTELQAHLAANGVVVPTIIITAHDGAAARTAAERYGSLAFLRKPFEDRDLIDAVRHAMAARS